MQVIKQSHILLGALLMSATGCMVTPNHNEELDTFVDIVRPAGFLRTPDTDVQVQLYNHRWGRWDTVATGKSRSRPIRWSGLDWYYWQTTEGFQVLDLDYWIQDAVGFGQCEMRVMAEGNQLFTFESWPFAWDKSLGDLATEGKASYQCTLHAYVGLYDF